MMRFVGIPQCPTGRPTPIREMASFQGLLRLSQTPANPDGALRRKEAAQRRLRPQGARLAGSEMRREGKCPLNLSF